MVIKHCCYGTCSNDSRYLDREGMEGVFFIPFPKPKTKLEQCLKWNSLCGHPHKDFNVDKIHDYTYICSKHFVQNILYKSVLQNILHNTFCTKYVVQSILYKN